MSEKARIGARYLLTTGMLPVLFFSPWASHVVPWSLSPTVSLGLRVVLDALLQHGQGANIKVVLLLHLRHKSTPCSGNHLYSSPNTPKNLAERQKPASSSPQKPATTPPHELFCSGEVATKRSCHLPIECWIPRVPGPAQSETREKPSS